MEAKSNIWPETKSPLQQICEPVFDRAGIQVFIKRDDLLQPCGGNKWRKLKYNYIAMLDRGKGAFATFGGPFSNHIYAAAELARHFGLKGRAYVRGLMHDPSNPVLSFVASTGMEVIRINKDEYARRNDAGFARSLGLDPLEWHIIPEGGSNVEGIEGCREIPCECRSQLGRESSYYVLPLGTGGTAAGVAQGVDGHTGVLAFACLRENIADEAVTKSMSMAGVDFDISYAYHFGGMAKWNKSLLDMIAAFHARHQILLDPIYTGKAMYGLFDLASKGYFRRGSEVVFIHTGGMPGRMAFEYRYGMRISES